MRALKIIVTGMVMLSATFGLTTHVFAAGSKKPPTDKQLIASAMSAAPAKVAKGATIVAMEADGKMRTLRQGTNGFSCMPDNPATPGPDPMCMDKNAMEWVHAWIAHTNFQGKSVLCTCRGGTDAALTRTRPSLMPRIIGSRPGRTMIVGADASFYDMYPKSADPDTSVPYAWAGSSHQHPMAPGGRYDLLISSQ
jgi:hypothetical protein